MQSQSGRAMIFERLSKGIVELDLGEWPERVRAWSTFDRQSGRIGCDQPGLAIVTDQKEVRKGAVWNALGGSAQAAGRVVEIGAIAIGGQDLSACNPGQPIAALGRTAPGQNRLSRDGEMPEQRQSGASRACRFKQRAELSQAATCTAMTFRNAKPAQSRVPTEFLPDTEIDAVCRRDAWGACRAKEGLDLVK